MNRRGDGQDRGIGELEEPPGRPRETTPKATRTRIAEAHDDFAAEPLLEQPQDDAADEDHAGQHGGCSAFRRVISTRTCSAAARPSGVWRISVSGRWARVLRARVAG